MGFQQALSGLNAASRNLDVIGNNIANVNTVGSKMARAEFQDMYAASISGGGSGFGGNVGIGVNPGVVAQQFTQGNITSTGNPLDLAINGGGFFQLTDGRNPTVYSRNGQFKVDTNGFIVNNGNLQLLGYKADAFGTIIPGVAAPIQLPTSGIAPAFTSRMSMEFNTDSRMGRPSGIPKLMAGLIPGTSTPATIDTTAVNNLNFTTAGAAATPGSASVTPSTMLFGTAAAPQIDGSSSTITHTALDFSNTYVAQVDATMTSTGPVTTFDYSGPGLAQFDVSFDGGITKYGVTLTSNYTDAAGVAAAIQTQLRAATGNTGFTVTANGTDNLVFTNTGSLNAVEIMNSDLAANGGGIADQLGAAGTAASGTDLRASFNVDGTLVTLNTTYADTATLAAAITGQLTGYTAVVDEALDQIVLSQTGSLAAVNLTAAGAFTARADATGFAAATGAAGTPAVATTNATFTIDGYAITLNTNYASYDALAADLDFKMDVAAGSNAYTVTNSGGTLTAIRNGSTGIGSASIDITVADANATSTGFGVATGTTGVDAILTTNAVLTVDGTPITLNQDAGASTATLATQLTALMQASALGANYSAAVDATSGNIVITHAGSPLPVVISAADTNAIAVGLTNTPGVAGTATTSAVTPDQERINISDPTTYNNATSTTIYDVKGQPITLTYYFQKVSPDTWNIYATANGQPVNGVTGETAASMRPLGTINYPNTGSNPTATGGGSIDTYAWAADGLTQTPTNVTSGDITLPSIPVVQLASGGNSEIIPAFTLNLRNITQFGGAFGVTDLASDGNAPGALTGVSIGSDGILTTRYSNGQTQVAGAIELASFRNAQGLQPMGGNVWGMSSVSGTPIYNTPGLGNLGVLQSGAVEESNVDLTAELVNMMTAQRAYQANAQTIKTQDQVMSTLVNLR